MSESRYSSVRQLYQAWKAAQFPQSHAATPESAGYVIMCPTCGQVGHASTLPEGWMLADVHRSEAEGHA